MRSQFGRATASGILEDSTLKKDAARRGKRAGNSVNHYTLRTENSQLALLQPDYEEQRQA